MLSSGAQAQDAALGYGSPKTSAHSVTALSWPFSSFPPTESGDHQYTTLENGKKDKAEDFTVTFIPAPLFYEHRDVRHQECLKGGGGNRKPQPRRSLHFELDIASPYEHSKP